MSLVGAFIAGVTGIDAQAQKFGAISDNIANANTVGYKPTSVLFKTLVTPRSIPTNYAPGGVIPTPVARMDLQGLLSASSSTTDIGISGRGFLPVTNAVNTTSGAVATGADLAVTRAGSFKLDKNGFMVNAAGFYLMGTAAGSTLATTLATLQPVKLAAGPNVTIGGTATTAISINGNIPASDAIGATRNFSTGVFDSSGNSYSVNVQLTKTALNTWSAVATSVSPVDSTKSLSASVSGSPVTLSFGSTGNLTSPTSAASLGTLTLNGTTTSPTFDFIGNAAITALTQFGDAFAISGVQQNGASSGTRVGVQIDSAGMVQEIYSNGQVIPRYQIPVVNYNNPQGLEAQGGTAWLETTQSGAAQLHASGADGAGQIMPSTLEQSSVDLANEFSDLIVSQATYQANTKTITTADEMYKTVTQLR
jgi:flagellar hook protein FlgE